MMTQFPKKMKINKDPHTPGNPITSLSTISHSYMHPCALWKERHMSSWMPKTPTKHTKITNDKQNENK
jgi:hypothetical protein